MATDRPKIVIYSDEKTIEKLDKIAKERNRSRGNMADTIIKEWLAEHEENQNNIINMKPFA